MCVRVIYSSHVTTPWDHRSNTITLPVSLCPSTDLSYIAIRAVLTETGTPQGVSRAVCWCGDDINLDVVPILRMQQIEVMARGA